MIVGVSSVTDAALPSWQVIRHASRWMEELPSTPIRWLLSPFWLPWRLIIGLRNDAYDRRLLPAACLPMPVVSIGNLTAGGTGKTPAALAVVAALRARGWHPAILSRGYRGVDGINDEAMLAGDIPVICNPDRHAGGLLAQADGADCVVLDDGFQHRQLHRDLDIVVIDATRPWGRDDGRPGAVLPLGYLREGRSGLQRAGLLWLTRTDLVSQERLSRLRSELSGLAPIVEERTTSAVMVRLRAASAPTASESNENSEPSTAWNGRRVVLVSGIGHPGGFEMLASALGLQVVASHRFPDHHHYSATDVALVSAAADKADAALVMTSKDAVKIQAFLTICASRGAWVLTVESQLVDDAPLQQALAHLRAPVSAPSEKPLRP